ncbi:phosphorylated adapter RNA export protein isoform X2 [Halyomorpha halys]|nr:phosphorylated adapter RNA export protein isoform X2 [Halyomorpha halys]
MQLEEGEIEDESGDEIDPYTPLERPSFIHAINSAVEKNHSDEDLANENSSSDDNSDSDSCIPKRAKIRRKMPSNLHTKKKYSIWCKNSNEQLTDFLGSFGMRNPENDRNVENYMVPNDMIHRKRKIPVRKDGLDPDLIPKVLNALETTEANTYEEVATDIATKLEEPNKGLVLRIVIIVGKDKAIDFYNKTKEIEKDGGMLIINKSRRRTSGGIFIYLIRHDDDITQSQKSEIFEENKLKESLHKQLYKKRKNRKKHKEWTDKMNEEKASESGQEMLSNPPPSPEPHPSESLPELPLRRDLVGLPELPLRRDLVELPELPLRRDIVELPELPLRRDPVEYDDLTSMDLIYD